MHKEVWEYVETMLNTINVADRSVLEVGSLDFNGTVRETVMPRAPETYIGVDLLEGPGVDVVCSADRLVERFGENRFDLILTTEMMEHVENWRGAIDNMKRVLKPQGHLILTTRSIGTPYHGYPFDYWRYELSDMQKIFDDFEIIELSPDPGRPGVFLTARKPLEFAPRSLEHIALYSILTRRRMKQVPSLAEHIVVAWIGISKKSHEYLVKVRMTVWGLLPLPLRRFLKQTIFK